VWQGFDDPSIGLISDYERMLVQRKRGKWLVLRFYPFPFATELRYHVALKEIYGENIQEAQGKASTAIKVENCSYRSQRLAADRNFPRSASERGSEMGKDGRDACQERGAICGHLSGRTEQVVRERSGR
jgi:hypothetical protein